MSSFGQQLRSERLSRGVGLEQITAVTKISQHHLVALEKDEYCQLPGGILSKGIVRGYAGTLGLDQRDWTERFVRAATDSGQVSSEEFGWAEFARNVGSARIQQREAAEMRMRWIGAIVLLLVVAAGAFFSVRYLGVRQGWWSSILPFHGTTEKACNVIADTVSRFLS